MISALRVSGGATRQHRAPADKPDSRRQNRPQYLSTETHVEGLRTSPLAAISRRSAATLPARDIKTLVGRERRGGQPRRLEGPQGPGPSLTRLPSGVEGAACESGCHPAARGAVRCGCGGQATQSLRSPSLLTARHSGNARSPRRCESSGPPPPGQRPPPVDAYERGMLKRPSGTGTGGWPLTAMVSVAPCATVTVPVNRRYAAWCEWPRSTAYRAR